MIQKKRRVCSRKIRSANTVKNWPGCLADVPCVILGAGPSLDDCDASFLENFFTIGINRAFLKIDPTILIWQDMDLFMGEKKKVKRLEAIKFCRYMPMIPEDYYCFRVTSTEFQMPKELNHLHGRGATGPLAFQLAWKLGCNPIFILGMDCKYRGKKTNFYGKNALHSRWTLPNCIKGLKWMKSFKERRTVVNCSDNDVFDSKISFDKAIDMYSPPHITREEIKNRLISKKSSS